MKPWRPRFTIRSVMALVVMAGLLMGGLVGVRGVWQYVKALDRVRYHAGMENALRWGDQWRGQFERDLLEGLAGMAQLTQGMRAMRDAGVDKGLSADLDEMRRREEELRAAVEEYRRKRALWDRQTEYHAAMAGKYRLVARFPWLPIGPDPPEPQ